MVVPIKQILIFNIVLWPVDASLSVSLCLLEMFSQPWELVTVAVKDEHNIFILNVAYYNRTNIVK